MKAKAVGLPLEVMRAPERRRQGYLQDLEKAHGDPAESRAAPGQDRHGSQPKALTWNMACLVLSSPGRWSLLGLAEMRSASGLTKLTHCTEEKTVAQEGDL